MSNKNQKLKTATIKLENGDVGKFQVTRNLTYGPVRMKIHDSSSLLIQAALSGKEAYQLACALISMGQVGTQSFVEHAVPKFKVGDEVVYHAGNWKYIVLGILWDEKGSPNYVLNCNDDSCEIGDNDCNHPDEHLVVHKEKDLISYDEWCEHQEEEGCEICCP